MSGNVTVVNTYYPATTASVTVAVGVNYGAYVNYGTWRMPPRPFWTNAEATVSDEFRTVAQALAKDLVP